MKSASSLKIAASRESMDGHPTLVFKPVYKSFRFKTSEPVEGLKVEKHTSLKDNNVFIANLKPKNLQVVQSPHPDEQWKAAMDYDLPELVAFFQDSGQDEFVKDIPIDSGVPSQNKCLEENRDLDLINDSCMVSSDAESSSDSSAESEDSSESSNSTVLKHIPEQLWEEEVGMQSGLENLTIEHGERFGEEDDTSRDHSTKKTVTETLSQIRQVPTKAVWSDSVLLSSTHDDSRQSKASLETALDYARRGEVFPLSVEFHSRNSSKDGMSGSLSGLSSKSQHQGKNARRRGKFRLFPQSDSSKDEMSDGVTGLCQSQQHCSTNARRKEMYPQSDPSDDWMSVSITGCSQSQEHRCDNARREVWRFSVESHPQDSFKDPMSDSVTESSQSQDSVTESSQSQQHHRGESCSSVPEPLAIYPSGAIPSFGSTSFRSNSSATSSRSFTFPILSSEWIGSPVRMVEADRTKLRRRHRWGVRFLCCSC